MRIQLLYFDECPSWQVADARLREALAAVGNTTDVERVLVTTADAAESWGFHGSPSVLVDGEDPFAEPGAPVGCRAGCIAPLPGSAAPRQSGSWSRCSPRG
ncbi:thioredoxin family protein [Cellulomonas sp. KRMCY2]|uniref:thioredoxin family protein n=1 Tax=Cellulomonas sp. KRMCY2 TaxID=1304865 RepID=UPI0004BC1A14